MSSDNDGNDNDNRAHSVDRPNELLTISQIPWCAKLLQDPSFTTIPTNSRLPKSDTEDSFFAVTLATNSTIRACVTQQRPPLKIAEEVQEQKQDQEQEQEQEQHDQRLSPFPAIHEVRSFITLGDDVNGYPHIAHGGFTATLLDEVSGILLTSNKNVEGERQRRRQRRQLQQRSGNDGTSSPWQRISTYTASLHVDYKKPVPTPGTILVRAWFDRIEGRKFFIRSTVGDGVGGIYAQGTAIFVQVAGKL